MLTFYIRFYKNFDHLFRQRLLLFSDEKLRRCKFKNFFLYSKLNNVYKNFFIIIHMF